MVSDASPGTGEGNRITVHTADESDAHQFDAVLVHDRSVVCVDADADAVWMIPFSKLSGVDASPDAMIPGPDLPESFYCGGQYGFVVVEKFPDLRDHLEDAGRGMG